MDIKAAIAKPASAQKFASTFVEAYLSPAFGARSKSEIDILVFTCLIDAKAIDPDAPIYDLARTLNITPARARALILSWQLRWTPTQADLRQSIVDALKKTRFSKDGTLLTFGVESPLLKEDIAARLKRKGVFPDASFSKELVKLPVEAFVEFLDEIVDERTKKEVRATLVKDKQLPDTSFKALATGVLTKLGEAQSPEPPARGSPRRLCHCHRCQSVWPDRWSGVVRIRPRDRGGLGSSRADSGAQVLPPAQPSQGLDDKRKSMGEVSPGDGCRASRGRRPFGQYT
jgi:hypothetical protein